MNILSRLSFYVVIVALLSTACSYVPFAGGALDGDVAPTPTDWRSVSEVPIIQLETMVDDPYSVKLWVTARSTHLWVFAGDNYSQWAQNIDADPRVRLKVDDVVYELQGQRVTEETEFQEFAAAWLEKYSSDRTDSKAADTYLYRLTSR